MTYLQHRRWLKARIEEARCKQPLRTSAEAYAGMEQMKALTNGRLSSVTDGEKMPRLNAVSPHGIVETNHEIQRDA